MMAMSQEIGGKAYQQLCETDRYIVGRKRHDAQLLIQKFITEPIVNTNPLALVPVSSSTRQKKNKKTSAETSFPFPSVHLNWDVNWPSMDDFFQKMSIVMDPMIVSKELAQTKSSKRIKNQKLAICQNSSNQENRPFDIKSLRDVMERELQDLGIAHLQNLTCDVCGCYYPADCLYMITLPCKKQKSKNTTVNRCGGCWKGPLPSRSLSDLLVKGIAEKWAKKVEQRVECLYGDWDEKLTPMVKMLKENVLLAEDIAALLKGCNDSEDFKNACEVIILTTIVFYLDYVDFRRSCEALLAIKPTVTYSQLFEIFAIYFPNRAKGIKTGDFL
ncbi:hypothetical protein CRE_28574 [Caenorhabditis remanei]|uniref:Uncharacterized protein n=1 Tax=Caenorhabditis remanei TaxID=31234 RepID=E3LN52_CAERE|nr:hypothetical protein CRE_28574 [Caenorhabditis remanei]